MRGGERSGARPANIMTGQLGSQMKSRLEFDIACGRAPIAWGLIDLPSGSVACACLAVFIKDTAIRREHAAWKWVAGKKRHTTLRPQCDESESFSTFLIHTVLS